MAGYNDTKQMIIDALTGRPPGLEIQPEDHQSYALNMLDYIRSVEMVSSSSIVGIADENTTPIQPHDANVSYIAGVGQGRTTVFRKFIDSEGKPITITTGEMHGVLVVFMWNTSNWHHVSFNTNIISHAENANFYYNYNVRKTYSSFNELTIDSFSPIGDDGRAVKLGDLVTVVDLNDGSGNGFYSRTESGWKLQSGFNFEVVQEEGVDINLTMSQHAITEALGLKMSKVEADEKLGFKLDVEVAERDLATKEALGVLRERVVFLSEAEYAALEEKDDSKYYYVYEEE